jgi:putative transposase
MLNALPEDQKPGADAHEEPTRSRPSKSARRGGANRRDDRPADATLVRRATEALHAIAAIIVGAGILTAAEQETAARELRALYKAALRGVTTGRLSLAAAMRMLDERASDFRAKATPRVADRLKKCRQPSDVLSPSSAPESGAKPPLRLVSQESVQPHRLCERSDDEMAKVGETKRLVNLMVAGRSARQALIELGLEPTASKRRWIQKRYHKYLKTGTVQDGRWHRVVVPTVLVPFVIARIEKHYFGRKAAGPRAVWKLVIKDIRAENAQRRANGIAQEVREPAYETVKAYLHTLSPHDAYARNNGMKEWRRQMMPRVVRETTTYANELWQLDHTRLDTFIRRLREGKWEAGDAWLSVAIDVHSRAVMGFVLADAEPDATTVLRLLHNAFAAKKNGLWSMRGLPDAIATDHGVDFKSNAVVVAMRALGIQHVLCPPNDPDAKGEVERWFRTISTGLLPQLPGARAIGTSATSGKKRVGTLLTLSQLLEEVETWILEDYHRRVHSTTRRKPGEHWFESVRLREPDAGELDVVLLKADKERVIGRNGIELTADGGGGLYWDPALVTHVNKRANVRYNPDAMESVVVYDADSGEYLATAYRMGAPDAKYSAEDVIRFRTELAGSLRQRMRAHAEAVENEDRAKAAAAEAEEIAKHTAPEDAVGLTSESVDPPVSKAEAAEAGEVNNLMAMMRGRRKHNPESTEDAGPGEST